MFELTASVLGGEPPVYDGGGLVAFAFERRDLPSQRRFIADPAVQTLPAEDAQLDFTMFNQLPWLGVWCSSRRLAMRRASDGANAS